MKFRVARHWLELANQWLDSTCDSTLPWPSHDSDSDSTRKKFRWLWLAGLVAVTRLWHITGVLKFETETSKFLHFAEIFFKKCRHHFWLQVFSNFWHFFNVFWFFLTCKYNKQKLLNNRNFNKPYLCNFQSLETWKLRDRDSQKWISRRVSRPWPSLQTTSLVNMLGIEKRICCCYCKPKVAPVIFTDSDSAPFAKFCNPVPRPGLEIWSIWESDSCSKFRRRLLSIQPKFTHVFT